MSTWLLLTLGTSAGAAELAGVSMPDTAVVGGQSLVLNGMGLREKYFIDVYVGALYLQAKTRDGAAAIQADAPKRLVMHFVYSDVPVDKLNETYDEGFALVAGASELSAEIATLKSYMASCTTGDEIAFDYVPGTGTTVLVKGKAKGTIAGAGFMRALWTVYVGPNPPTAKLKAGMLAG